MFYNLKLRNLAFFALTFFLHETAQADFDQLNNENSFYDQMCGIMSDYSFDAQINILCLQPTGSNLDYAAEAFPIPLPSPNWKIYGIHPDYSLGFDLGIMGICHDRSANLQLNWEHFCSKNSAHKTVSSENMIGPFFEIGPDASAYKKAHGHVNFHFDAVDLNYGVFVHLSECLQTNVFAGIGFAGIRETRFTKFSNYEGTITRTIEIPSDFIGAGPQFGVDLSYYLTDTFQLAGEAVGSVLVGRIKNHTRYKATSPLLALIGVSSPNDQSTRVKDSTQVVPAFKGSLGVACTPSFCDWAVKLEAGYQVQVYLNAIQSVEMGSEVITPPVIPDTIGVFARTFRKTKSNFALAGPYLKLNIVF